MKEYALQIVFLCGAITLASRLLPFMIFSEAKKTPESIQYLSNYLPLAMVGMLILYCLKDVDFRNAPFGICELLAIAAVVSIHLWKRNMLLSIVGGTFLYMVLLQLLT